MGGVLAIDIGASGGRHLYGSIENGRLRVEEIYRFPNRTENVNGRLCWQTDELWAHVLEGLRKCGRQGKIPASVGVDTWAVDYALTDGQGRLLGPCAAYRDRRTEGLDRRLEARLPFAEMYRRTGIARQPFNTVYQLMAEDPATLDRAARCLLMPDWFHARLCGQAVNEYTNASTTSLLNARTRRFDPDILNAAGIPAALFPEDPVMPGTRLGRLTPQVAAQVGFDCEVILPATHDTGSAFLAVPDPAGQAAYLSSGTWSLLGAETEAPVLTQAACLSGMTNEGGYGGRIRFLRNITGLWILQCLRREWNDRWSFAQMADMAREGARYRVTLDAGDSRFLAPTRMQEELLAAIREQGDPPPQTDGELLACVGRSLALCYARGVRQLEALTGKRYASLNIVGGGSRNQVLNQWTADLTGLPVYAGPAEGTAIGNMAAQLIAWGELASVREARELIRRSFPVERYEPRKEG